MRYLSVCSGIEAASAAWGVMGWTPVAFSEVKAFPSAVLAERHPGVPNLGDMTKFKDWPDATVDLLVGGTPCQSFSVAGLRKGMADPRTAIAYCGWQNVGVGEGKPFVLVEGQLDALRCWSVGLKTAIAPQGTSITEGQLALLRRYHPQVECFFDSDSAGQKAALRLLSDVPPISRALESWCLA